MHPDRSMFHDVREWRRGLEADPADVKGVATILGALLFILATAGVSIGLTDADVPRIAEAIVALGTALGTVYGAVRALRSGTVAPRPPGVPVPTRDLRLLREDAAEGRRARVARSLERRGAEEPVRELSPGAVIQNHPDGSASVLRPGSLIPPADGFVLAAAAKARGYDMGDPRVRDLITARLEQTRRQFPQMDLTEAIRLTLDGAEMGGFDQLGKAVLVLFLILPLFGCAVQLDEMTGPGGAGMRRLTLALATDVQGGLECSDGQGGTLSMSNSAAPNEGVTDALLQALLEARGGAPRALVKPASSPCTPFGAPVAPEKLVATEPPRPTLPDLPRPPRPTPNAGEGFDPEP